MRIVCPTCSAAYEIPPERVAPGRPVRCARCAGTWVPLPVSVVTVPDTQARREPDPDPPSVEAGTPPEFEFDPTGPVAPAAPVRAPAYKRFIPSWPPSEPALLLGAWILTALILLTAGWIVVARRAEIVQVWPPSERVYAALGLLPRPD